MSRPVQIYRAQKRSDFTDFACCAGELPLALIRMKAKGCDIDLRYNYPGFALPSNIGELGDDIAKLDLSNCSLEGKFASS